jgi:hypothetical protein
MEPESFITLVKRVRHHDLSWATWTISVAHLTSFNFIINSLLRIGLRGALALQVIIVELYMHIQLTGGTL